MSERRTQIHTEHELPKTRRCKLLDVAHSTAYYRPEPASEADLALMRLIDEIFIFNGRSTAAGAHATSSRGGDTMSTASGSSVSWV